MTSQSPARDFLLPRLVRLLDEAVSNGFERSVAVAVLIDLVTSSPFDTAATDPAADSQPHADYDRGPGSIVLVNGSPAHQPVPIDAQDEADFIKPIDWLSPS